MGNRMQKSISHTGNQLETSYTFEINNLSEKKATIKSPIFLSGGYEWSVDVYPKGTNFDNHLWLYLGVHNPNSFRSGWKRRAHFRFHLLSKSGKVLYTTPDMASLFCAQFPVWGDMILPHSKLKKGGFLMYDRLTIKVEVKVVEVGYITGKDMFDLKGFNVLSTQVDLVSLLFVKHPDIAVDFKPKDQAVKTAYMNVLLSLIETLRMPPQSFSETDLSNVQSKLSELTEAGFKLEWLKTKLEEVSLERKNAIADGSRVEQVEDRIKNLELTLLNLNLELKKDKAISTAAAKLLSFEEIV